MSDAIAFQVNGEPRTGQTGMTVLDLIVDRTRTTALPPVPEAPSAPGEAAPAPDDTTSTRRAS